MYYGRTPAVSEALYLLNQQTPYNFGFWFGEIFVGILIPAILFLSPRFNQKSTNLVWGALTAVLGLVVNRWNTTVSGLFVPLSYSPGTLYRLPPGAYWPNLVEWGVAVGIAGYGLLMLTLGILFLPLFVHKEQRDTVQ
jgi:molybdopterin-containing oxidoreductase family membrane subunit